MNSSPKGESIKTIFNPIFKNMKNMQTCMDSNQIQPSKLVQMDSFLQEHDEFMEYDQKMDMHVRKHELTTTKLKKGNMHATIKLQFNI